MTCNASNDIKLDYMMQTLEVFACIHILLLVIIYLSAANVTLFVNAYMYRYLME